MGQPVAEYIQDGFMQLTLSYVENLARQAGEILRAGYDKEHQVGYKGVIDLVTGWIISQKSSCWVKCKEIFPIIIFFQKRAELFRGMRKTSGISIRWMGRSIMHITFPSSVFRLLTPLTA